MSMSPVVFVRLPVVSVNPPDRADDERRKFKFIGSGEFKSVPEAMYRHEIGDPEKFGRSHLSYWPQYSSDTQMPTNIFHKTTGYDKIHATDILQKGVHDYGLMYTRAKGIYN